MGIRPFLIKFDEVKGDKTISEVDQDFPFTSKQLSRPE